jgi:hypothetical protein
MGDGGEKKVDWARFLGFQSNFPIFTGEKEVDSGREEGRPGEKWKRIYRG